MDRIRLRGGKPLQGSIGIGGAKNAALPLMAASLLTAETLSLSNVPHLADIATMAHLLQQHGVDVAMDGGNGTAEGRTIHLTAGHIASTLAPYDLVRKMRASVLVLGPLLARCGEAEVSLPGGCAIGTRPVDLHIAALREMGAEIEIANGYIKARAPKGLKGAHIRFPMVSVGATENLLMAACLAEGNTILENAAREPEIGDLARCLIAMGAQIEGLDSETLTVRGQTSLHGARHMILPDRIETGTYAAAVAITGGEVELIGARPDLTEAVNDKLVEAGCVITPTPRGMLVKRNGSRLKGVDFLTQPFPGFPTDMQAQVMSIMAVAEGASMITETIFENRFMHVPELTRMGANIVVHGSSALVRGVSDLTGAPVMATDLRASVSLVLAGLAAHGETIVNRVYHLDRGYERLEEKLAPAAPISNGSRDDQAAAAQLRAEDAEDITVLSACLQDATLQLADIAWQPRRRRFALVLNRFRWEDEDKTRRLGAKPHFRSQAGLHFDGVLRVQRQRLEAASGPLELLSVLVEPADEPPAARLTLVFAGGGAVRLDVECIAAELQDIGTPYPVRRIPKHQTDDRQS